MRMSGTAYLILENGAVFEGSYFGAEGTVTGEVVFSTGMTGYLETLTDKSYHGQIVLQTFPLIGNYGVIPQDFVSGSVGAAAYIVKNVCRKPSNFRSEGDLDSFLKSRDVVGLCGIDTRALTKLIRENGVMNGRISNTKPVEDDLREVKAYTIKNAVESVSSNKVSHFKAENPKYTVAVLDFGMSESFKRDLLVWGCDVWVFPHNTSAEDLMKVKPDGVMLSNGPGDPAENTGIIGNIKDILGLGVPVFGVCLGHQLLALANGFKTVKLKHGHRGANQPVKDLISGRVYITNQNHGYAVVSESIRASEGEEWFVNVNDRTCEGIIYKNAPAFSSQFYPETTGRRESTSFVFERFIESMEGRVCR